MCVLVPSTTGRRGRKSVGGGCALCGERVARCMREYMCVCMCARVSGGWCALLPGVRSRGWVIDYNHRRTGAATDPQSLGTPGRRSTLFPTAGSDSGRREEGDNCSRMSTQLSFRAKNQSD